MDGSILADKSATALFFVSSSMAFLGLPFAAFLFLNRGSSQTQILIIDRDGYTSFLQALTTSPPVLEVIVQRGFPLPFRPFTALFPSLHKQGYAVAPFVEPAADGPDLYPGFPRGFRKLPIVPVEQVECFLNRLDVVHSCFASMIACAFNSVQLFVRIPCNLELKSSFSHHHGNQTGIVPNDIDKLPSVSSIAVELLSNESIDVFG